MELLKLSSISADMKQDDTDTTATTSVDGYTDKDEWKDVSYRYPHEDEYEEDYDYDNEEEEEEEEESFFLTKEEEESDKYDLEEVEEE